MRLLLKLLIVVALPAMLIWAVGRYATSASDKSLRGAIEQRSRAEARAMMDEIDRLLHTRIANWRAYARSQLVHTTLRTSNEEFAALPDVSKHLREEDSRWIEMPDGELSQQMRDLMSNALGQDLRLWLDKLAEVNGGHPVYDEVFLTNQHGANVAMTRRTTDYAQGDEEWWLQAKEVGIHVGDVQHDQSTGESGIPICLRVDNSQNEMLGVLKAVLDMDEIFKLLDARATSETQHVGQSVILFSGDRRILHVAKAPGTPPRDEDIDVPDFSEMEEDVQLDWRTADALGTERLSAFAMFRSAGGFPELKWTVLVDRDATQALLPVRNLSRNLLLMSVGATLAALVLSGAIALSLSQRIKCLAEGTVAVAQGNLDSSILVQGNDELGDLERSFNQMTADLKGYASSLERTNRELAVAKDAAEAANRAKSNFLAIMSHEIRTPLNAVLGMTELVLDTPLEEQQQEYLGLVYRSAESLTQIVHEILDFSRVETGQMNLDSSAFDVRGLLGDVHQTLSLRARERNLQLTSNISDEVPHTLVGDARRLRQVVTNLISNAIKFTEQGGVDVAVDCSDPASDSVLLRVTVTDTGIGIPPDKLRSIFDAFNQADTSDTRRYGGIGLGLSICSRMAELMGGQLQVESQEGQGSRFQLQVRLGIGDHPPPPAAMTGEQIADRQAQPETRSCEPVASSPGAGAQPCHVPAARILLVEDSVTNQKLALGLLKKSGHQVSVASNGREAVEAVQKQEFDLVLMDVQMPDMDGLEATRVIRQAEQQSGRHLPILALTARAMQGDRELCLEAGMDGYVAKPIRRAELNQALAQLLVAVDLRHSPTEPAGESDGESDGA